MPAAQTVTENPNLNTPCAEPAQPVRSYVKNQGLGSTIPYTIDGQQRAYVPDFVARIDDGRGDDNLRKPW
jgi:hypothetical protein